MHQLVRHTSAVSCVVKHSTKHQTVYTGSWDRTAVAWDARVRARCAQAVRRSFAGNALLSLSPASQKWSFVDTCTGLHA